MTTRDQAPLTRWGLGTRATTEALSRKEGTDFCVATIGPAGENLLPYACIINSSQPFRRRRHRGRARLQEVEGFVVRGTQPIYGQPARGGRPVRLHAARDRRF